MMVRRTWLGVVLAGFLVVLTGCESGGSTTSKEALEKDMAERLYYHDVKLKDEGGGRFTGTAIDDREDLVNLEVTQTKDKLSWKTSFKGSDGRTRTSQGSTNR